MTEFRQVTDRFSVSPQITVEDVAEAARQGFSLIINNRPDAENPPELSSAAMQAAAAAAGVGYLYIPVAGGPGPTQVAQVREAVAGTDGKVLAYCRSGTRSIFTWALGQVGAIDSAELRRLGAAAGYDLSPIVG